MQKKFSPGVYRIFRRAFGYRAQRRLSPWQGGSAGSSCGPAASAAGRGRTPASPSPTAGAAIRSCTARIFTNMRPVHQKGRIGGYYYYNSLATTTTTKGYHGEASVPPPLFTTAGFVGEHPRNHQI